MATSLARLRLADTVDLADVEESFRLYNCSRDSIATFGSQNLDAKVVLQLIQDYCEKHNADMIEETEFLDLAETRGHDPNIVEKALKVLDSIESISLQNDQIILIDTPMFA